MRLSYVYVKYWIYRIARKIFFKFLETRTNIYLFTRIVFSKTKGETGLLLNITVPTCLTNHPPIVSSHPQASISRTSSHGKQLAMSRLRGKFTLLFANDRNKRLRRKKNTRLILRGTGLNFRWPLTFLRIAAINDPSRVAKIATVTEKRCLKKDGKSDDRMTDAFATIITVCVTCCHIRSEYN